MARVRGIVLTHGDLGRELVKTAVEILGPQDDLIVMSNEGKSLAQLGEELDSLLADAEKPTFVFVDLQGGSCGQVAMAVTKRHPEVPLACGVNLPMLLEFLHHRDRVGLAELSERIEDRGRGGVACIRWEQKREGP